MKLREVRPTSLFRASIAILSSATLLILGQPLALAQQIESQAMTTTSPATPEAPKIPNDQLDSLVAPIALYPDPLLSQTLVASTYPLEIIQLEQWLKKNPGLKDKALVDAMEKQPWDPSIQAMATFPDIVKRLADDVAWTTDLGNAFLAQQADVMAAIQRMRAKAQGTGNLKTSAQQKVETQTAEGGNQVIVIEQADPQVVYVPSYNPTIVYGAPAYPYPPIYYPTGGLLAFGTGVALGAAINGGWGYNCGWGHGDVTINNNNNFNRNNINSGNRGQGGKWQHNPQHRGGAPYGDRGTANKYGGNARSSGANRPAGGAGTGAANRPGGGIGNAGVGNRPGAGAGNMGNAGTNRPGGGAGGGAGARPRGGGASTMPASRPSGGGGDRVGSHNISSGGGSSAFGGGGFGGGGGNSARASSSRGSHSMGGGGFGGGGGGRRR
jgi:hypothetical protein